MTEKINIPQNAAFILSNLEKNGFEGYIVGGCVRDYLLGLTPKDWDITTNAKPEQIKAVFDALENCHTVDTGIQHGTVTVVLEHIGYEVTTYRIDGEYKDSRHPENVTFTDDITGDLARRDFTMNAIAYNPKKGFVDPFNGRDAIKKRLICGVGNAAARFDEDALRIMRALRFSAQLDFSIDEETLSAVYEKTPLIKNISIERVRDEFTKLIMTDAPQKITELYNCGALCIFMPGIRPDETMLNALKNSEKLLPVRLAVILDGKDNMESFLKALTYDNKTAKTTAALIKNRHMPQNAEKYDMRRLIGKIGKENTTLLLELKKAFGDSSYSVLNNLFTEIIQNNDCCTIKQLSINGSDLIAAGVPKGQKIGEMLEKALDAVMHDQSLNTKEKLFELLEI
ncbi:MAG: CCA tRNA nucleotidyltransferase [Firmicutes bacterium]|nr:CCA tRNA nucleotidyltransferase [Bacillota bacterium]